jgi:glucose dehydrogenase
MNSRSNANGRPSDVARGLRAGGSIRTTSTKAGKHMCFAGVGALLLAGLCFAQSQPSPTPHVTLSKSAGPPTTRFDVSGSDFPAHVALKVFFGTKNLAMAVTDGRGSFSDIAIHAPGSAHPGIHSVSAVVRDTGEAAQAPFNVRTNWVEFGFTSSGTRVNPYENVLDPTKVRRLSLGWSYTAGDSIESSPAVANGVVYIGSLSFYLYALRADTGTVLWKYPINEAASPAVADGVVYFGSPGGNVYALNAQTGAKLWEYPIPDTVDSSPTVANGIVYVGAVDNKLHALDAQTGIQLWEYKTGNLVYSSPAVANGVVYFGSGDNYVYALNTGTGALLWKYATGGPVSSSPAVVNGVVYNRIGRHECLRS